MLAVERKHNTIIRQTNRIFQLHFFIVVSIALSHLLLPSPLSTVSAKRERWSRPLGANQWPLALCGHYRFRALSQQTSVGRQGQHDDRREGDPVDQTID